MGCDNSSSVGQIEDKGDNRDNKNGNKNKNKDNKDKNNIDEKEGTKDKINKLEEDKKEGSEKKENNDEKLILKEKNKKKSGEYVINTDENKDISNVMTEGVTNDLRKLNLQKQHYEGVILMKGVEEYIPEELNQEEIYQLVENALNENISENESKGKVTKKQIKAISEILYNKINKKGETDISKYPELKGVKVKIGVGKLTKDIIKDMMFYDKKVDECQIDLTYANLTKENDDIKALTIELIP